MIYSQFPLWLDLNSILLIVLKKMILIVMVEIVQFYILLHVFSVS